MSKHVLVILLFIIVFGGLSCGKKNNNTEKEDKKLLSKDSVISKTDTINSIHKYKKYSLKDFYTTDSLLNINTEKIFAGLDDRQRIAQMVITSAGSLGKSEESVAALISQKKIGGVLLLGGSKESFTGLVKRFNSIADSSKTLPLIFSADAEPSLINIKIAGIKQFKPANEIKSAEECGIIAKDISSILKTIGINQNYAPVCDFPYNKEIIGNRSFGSNIEELKKLVSEFIIKTQSENIVATAKHFPGHGNVIGDSHKGLVSIDGALKELEQFKTAISSGVISIMVGHIAVKNNKDYETGGLPATLSGKIVTGLLRNELGFKGIIITDGMNMGALNNFPSPSLQAVTAGCDMILMPSDETKLINSVYEEIGKDQKFKEQIYASVKRIIMLKLCLNLFK